MRWRLLYRDLGRMSYQEALTIQRQRFDELLAAKQIAKENPAMTEGGCAGTIFTVEHPAVYTLGKNGDAGNLLVDENFLRSTGAEFYRTDRGGDITFHGEGQIVCYPVLDLERIGIGLREYIELLERAVIETLDGYGIASERSEGASGVWLRKGSNVAQKDFLVKICAIGVRASRYITMHGFALNVTTDLSRFMLINPCGFSDRGVTSLERELGYAPPMDEVKKRVVTRLAELLDAELSDI